MESFINIKGARENNLKNISLQIPRDSLVVITGLSGSGKSSLAFDTIYAEGQRRYLESLSAYARQFLDQMEKPDVDSIDGLSPAISIEQKSLSKNPRSTVGTVTEIYDYLRLLFARAGTPYCPSCDRPIQAQTIQQIVDQVMGLPTGTRFAVMSPIARGKKGGFQRELTECLLQGFTRARIDGETVTIETAPKLKKNFKHDISISIDRLISRPGIESRLAQAIELATKLSPGLAEIENLDTEERRFYSTRFACVDCGTGFSEIEPRSFSFNSPHGACPTCNGLGIKESIDPLRVILHNKSLLEGAVRPWAKQSRAWLETVVNALAKKYKFAGDIPFGKLPAAVQKVLLFGSNQNKMSFEFRVGRKTNSLDQSFEGVVTTLERRLLEPSSEWDRWELEQYIAHSPCSACLGSRLKPEMLHVLFGKKNIAEVCDQSVQQCLEWLNHVSFSNHVRLIVEPIMKEIQSRLTFLSDVGLTYLSLNRSAGTLSGGEGQRIRLASQIGSNLVGVLYILDEPSIGLHQRDNLKLIQTLEKLRDNGNSVIVVEHDSETIERSDFIVDLGPGAGENGGRIVFMGSPGALKTSPTSLTGQYLSGTKSLPFAPGFRDPSKCPLLKLNGVGANNLKCIDVSFPLGTFICVTGVSGSGKSSLVIDSLLPALRAHLEGIRFSHRSLKEVTGLEHLDKAIHVDQAPIGRTPRSNPATYTGIFGDIRSLFALVPEAKAAGYSLSRFSFNVKGGRCEACGGDGTIKISMHFLPDVFVTCEVCRGRRYNRETLEIAYRGRNIAEVLNMTVEEAASFFKRIPSLHFKLQTLLDVGLSYLRLGQNAVTLSGGEAQRIKLSRELNRKASGKTLFILDEPTTGLHFDDVRHLLEILQRLVDQGNTVVVIEHNLDVIKQADYLIDLGPEGGDGGGHLLFQGRPVDLVSHPTSHTGMFLKKIFWGHDNTRASPSQRLQLPGNPVNH